MVSSLTTVNTVMSEQQRENINLTAQNLQLWTQKTDLERRTEELTREKDGLNWTMGVILEYENFPVNTHCPQRGENILSFSCGLVGFCPHKLTFELLKCECSHLIFMVF